MLGQKYTFNLIRMSAHDGLSSSAQDASERRTTTARFWRCPPLHLLPALPPVVCVTCISAQHDPSMEAALAVRAHTSFFTSLEGCARVLRRRNLRNAFKHQATMFSRFTGRSQPGTPQRQKPQNAASQGSALELINYNPESGKFHVGSEALQVLQQTPGPVGVVSVCGRARQGKSYILNQLLGQSSGFQVAPTHRPCTKGLWMWSTPVERTRADGSKYHLVKMQLTSQQSCC